MFADALLSETGRADFLDALRAKAPGDAPTWPGANVIRRGEAAEFPRVPEDAPALIGRAQECFSGLLPGNGWHVWLIDQIALTTLRLDRCGRSDRRMRDSAAIRAGVNWDEDRHLRAEIAGRRVAEVPRAVVAELRATPHGCDWLIRRWALLGRAAEAGPGWTEAQIALAHDLLATPAEARGEAPGGTDGGSASRVELAARQVSGLRRRKGEVMHWDAIERAMVEADLVVEPTAELRRLGRHEAQLRGWLRWLVEQVRTDPPKRLPPVGSYPRLPEAEPKPEAEADAPPQAEAQAPAAAEEAEADREVEAEPQTVGRLPLPRIVGGPRKEPKVIREAARSDARRRRRELRRA